MGLLFRVTALAAGLLVVGSCGRSTTPTTPPPPTEPQTDGVLLRYAPSSDPIEHRFELELTHTSLGLYLEAKLALRTALSTAESGSGLASAWTLAEIATLDMVGTVDEGDPKTARARLEKAFPRTVTIDAHGLVEPSSADDGVSTEGTSPAVAMLLTIFDEHLRLPRLPTTALQIGEAVELEEESETVLTDVDAVLPTTTVHRYTLRGVDDVGVAEVAVELVSIAEPSPAADDEPAQADVMRVEIRAEGTLLFDVERGLPVSLELLRTERFELGELEVDRGVQLRSEYQLP